MEDSAKHRPEMSIEYGLWQGIYKFTPRLPREAVSWTASSLSENEMQIVS